MSSLPLFIGLFLGISLSLTAAGGASAQPPWDDDFDQNSYGRQEA